MRGRVYGIVLPVPLALARRADRVRRHYDPNYRLIGPHVTLLPPRPLRMTRRQVLEAVRRIARKLAPVPLSLGSIETFLPGMPVVFAAISRGAESLERFHRRLHRAPLRGSEAFPYVPHLTLGQDLEDARLQRALALSRKIFSAPAARIAWQADSLIVVERHSPRLWIALPPMPIPGPKLTVIPERRRQGRR